MIMMQMEIRNAHKRPSQPANDPPKAGQHLMRRYNQLLYSSYFTIAPSLTSHGPRNSGHQSRLARSNPIVIDKLFVGQNDRHNTSIIAIKAG